MRVPIGTIFFDKSKSWIWEEKKRWWDIRTKVTGYYGTNGYEIEQTWQRNDPNEILHEDILTLNPEESDKLKLLPQSAGKK